MRHTCAIIMVTSGLFTTQAQAFTIFGNNGLLGGSRWDAAPRNVIGAGERSLADGLRFSVQGGSYQAYRNNFSWSSLPSVASFQGAVEASFNAWTVVDPGSGLDSNLSFNADFQTAVVGPGPNGTVNTLGAEIDLLAEVDGNLWNVGDGGLRAETFFNAVNGPVTLTSGTVGYNAFAISGADIKMNSNMNAQWTLPWFQLVLTHEIGHALGFGDVDVLGPQGRYIDDNYDGTNSATALATLTNSFAGQVNPLNPAASPFTQGFVANGDPGVDTFGVNILMETIIPGVLLNNATPLGNDDYAGRQFLYPFIPAPGGAIVLALAGLACGRRRRPLVILTKLAQT